MPRILLALLVLLAVLALTASAQAQDVTITVATFTTPEAEAAARADGTTIEARVAEAFGAFQAVLDSATVGSARVVVAPFPLVRLPLTETRDCIADRDQFFASARAHVVRDSLRANLAVLFPEWCSQTFQCTEGSSDCETYAFALAQARYAGPSRQALAHEAGHLFGMRHNAEDDPTPGDAHALLNLDAGFFTVVSQRGGLPREALVPYYSDPRRSIRGAPLGVAGRADNAAVLRRMAPVVATWRERAVAVSPAPPRAGALRVAPNPTAGAWRVTLAEASVAPQSATLLDALGRRLGVFEVAPGQREVVVPARGLAPGVYVLRVGGAAVRLVRSR